MTTTGNQALDALVDAIAQRLSKQLLAALGQNRARLLDVAAAAEYVGRSSSAVRHLIARGEIPCVRRDRRVLLDRADLDKWLELGKTRG